MWDVTYLYILVLNSVIGISRAGSSEMDVQVQTKIGPLIGISEHIEFMGAKKDITRFLGVPYAEPPTGSRRFQRAEAYHGHTSPYNATQFGPHCMQSDIVNKYIKYFKMSEDCLQLNIFVPGHSISDQNKYTVMIFIHGGSFTYSGAEIFSGDNLSAFHDVVIVTINYRLNTFGFLSNGTTSSGNMGLWDQKLAIQWVHDNIDTFGGDPEHVTLFGNSAGAASVLYQSLNPTNKGLFERVIAQSGSVLAQWALTYNPVQLFSEFIAEVECDLGGYDSILKCLQSKSAEEIVTYKFSPVVDGDFIKEEPLLLFSGMSEASKASLSLFADLDLLSGVTSKDGASAIAGLGDTLIAMGINISSGIPRRFLESHFIPPLLMQMYGNEIPQALVQATIQQYTDWAMPNEPILIRDQMVDLTSDVTFFVPAINVIKKHQQLDTPTGRMSYFYVFDYKPPFAPAPLWLKGAKHTMEVPYVFGLPDSMKIAAGFPPNVPMVLPADDVKLSSIIMTMWTNFAKTG